MIRPPPDPGTRKFTLPFALSSATKSCMHRVIVVRTSMHDPSLLRIGFSSCFDCPPFPIPSRCFKPREPDRACHHSPSTPPSLLPAASALERMGRVKAKETLFPSRWAPCLPVVQSSMIRCLDCGTTAATTTMPCKMHKQLGVSSGAMHMPAPTLESTPLSREAGAADLQSNQEKVRKKRAPIPLIPDCSRCLCASLKPGACGVQQHMQGEDRDRKIPPSIEQTDVVAPTRRWMAGQKWRSRGHEPTDCEFG
jgi:hypothetical protein